MQNEEWRTGALALGSGGDSTDTVAQEDIGWNWIPESTPKTNTQSPQEADSALSYGQSCVAVGWLPQEVGSAPSLVGFKKHHVKISLHHP